MKKLINILIISSLFLSCNAVTKHKDKELNKSEAEKVGNSYYHKDCNEIKNDISMISDLFIKNINQM